jgi:ATP-dependent Clp protease protease subunit
MLTKTIHPNLKSDVFNKHPLIILVVEFSEKSLEAFTKDFIDAEASGQEIIPIQIDSYGGQIHALLGMLAVIKSSKKTICTFTNTKACSCGSLLLSAGSKGYRYASKNADIMVHDMSSRLGGKTVDVTNDAAWIERLTEKLFKTLDENCGKEKGYFRNKMKNKGNVDMWYSAEQAKKEGLIDTVASPIFNIEVSQTFKILS